MNAPSPPFDAVAWSDFLTGELGRPVRVQFGRARRQVIVTRHLRDGLEVRMHGIFAEAPEDVREAVARWLASGRRARRACRALDAWIEEITPRLEPGRRETLRAEGRAHDLVSLRDEVVAAEFADEAFERGLPTVTWGRRGSRSARRSLQLGVYDASVGIIRIHPVLDQPSVPRWFVRYVMFHELLHAAHPEERSPGGRTLHHGPLFRARERAYPDFARAVAWQEHQLVGLLKSARTGKDLRPRTTGPLIAQAPSPAASPPAPRKKPSLGQRLFDWF